MAWLGQQRRHTVAAFVFCVAAACGFAAVGCFDSGDRPDRVPPPPPGPAALDLSVRHQQIDGFGASSAWTAPNLSDAQADLFFSPEKGIGLSLLRVQVKPTGITTELQTAKKAAARGAKVWAAPWSPPGEWKDNGTTNNGGSLLDAHRMDWANRLASFATTMAAEGVPLVALSAQNEPNYRAEWDTCVYSPAQLVTFVRDFLGPALLAQGQTVPIMAPETQGWDRFAQYADPLMADPGTVALMGPIAMHHYAGNPYDYAPAKMHGKALWQTEVSDDKSGQTLDRTIDSGLRVAAMIHDNLVLGNVSAWHYWWLLPNNVNVGNGGLAEGATLLPRAWVLGNWSRFVRPGFVRVEITAMPQPMIYASAFADPANGRFVIVAINQAYLDLAQDFTVAGGTAAEVTPWVTSAGRQLAAQGALPVVDGAFSATLPARSVTSFVGSFTP